MSTEANIDRTQESPVAKGKARTSRRQLLIERLSDPQLLSGLAMVSIYRTQNLHDFRASLEARQR